jgi:hypothetical protein
MIRVTLWSYTNLTDAAHGTQYSTSISAIGSHLRCHGTG